MNIVELLGIHRSMAKGKEVLHGIDLLIEPGEVVALLGANGAGKTTLLRIAMGLLHPHRGTIRLFGLELAKDPIEIKRRIGYVSEDQLLPSFMTVEGVFEVHRSLFPTWDRSLEIHLRMRFGLTNRRARISALSKGQKRQVALLCAVAHRPELLILDEPASGLDPAARRELIEVAIEALNEGSTLLFSSHHMQDVERLAARVALIHDGRLLIDRPLDELRERLTLVALPPKSPVMIADLRRTDGCLGARALNGVLHAVFEGQPREVETALAQRFDLEGLTCSRPSLEDFFVETVGGQP